jgi:glycosyltransferase involved in cell wall biosynthesis
MNLFDTRWLGRNGIGRFAAELLARTSGFSRIPLLGSPAAPLDPWKLRAQLREHAVDFFFSPGFNAPAAPSCPFAFCLHDLIHLRVPKWSTPLHGAYYECVVRSAVEHARTVLTVSEFSRGEVCEWARVPPERIVNVGSGVSPVFSPQGIRARLARPYFLYVGNHKRHKNLVRLLKAFAGSGLEHDFDLVLTGTPSAALRMRIAALGLSTAVEFTGSVPDVRLAELYRGATALLLPSLYEGFGLPAVEAMSCGTPVMASNAAALPETTGGAALSVDPLDEAAMSSAMLELATGGESVQGLRERGLVHARRFSWEAVAQRVAEVLPGMIGYAGVAKCASL